MTDADMADTGAADGDEEARSELLTAAHLAANDRERDVLLRKAAGLPQ